MPEIPFIGPGYTARSTALAADRLVNMYVELNETGLGARKAALYGTPGLRRLCTVPETPCRGLYTASTGRVFGVWGPSLYEVSPGFAATRLGAVGAGTTRVTMADNGLILVVVDGSTGGWSLTLATNALAAITDTAFYGANTVVCLDTYFLFDRPGTQQFYLWGPNATAATAFDGTDFTSVEGSADGLLALLADHRELWCFGPRSTEVYFNSGEADFPFARIAGAFLEHGLAAVHSVAKLDNTVYWLGADATGQGMVWKAAGYTPQRVSTHAIEYALSTYPTLADAEAYTYQLEGHSFYVLSFEAGGATWAFDASTGMWSQLAHLDPATGTLGRHRARGYTCGHGVHLVGDHSSGKLSQLDAGYYLDDADPITRLRAAPHVAADGKRVTLHCLTLEIEAGQGLDGAAAVADVEPQLVLRISRDGGKTWDAERWSSAGALGNYRQRAIWRRLGMGRDLVLEVSTTAACKTVWLGAALDATAGRS